MTALLTACVGIQAVLSSTDKNTLWYVRHPCLTVSSIIEVLNSLRVSPNMLTELVATLSGAASSSLEPGSFQHLNSPSVQKLFRWIALLLADSKSDIRCYTIKFGTEESNCPAQVDSRLWLQPNDVEVLVKDAKPHGIRTHRGAKYEYMDYVMGTHERRSVLIKRFKGCSPDVIEREAEIRGVLDKRDVTAKLIGLLPACGITFNRAAIVMQYYPKPLAFEKYLESCQLSKGYRVQAIDLCWAIARMVNLIHTDHIILNDFHFSHIGVLPARKNSENEKPVVMVMDLSAATMNNGINFYKTSPDVITAPEVKAGSVSSSASDIYSLGEVFRLVKSHFNVHELRYVIEWATRANPTRRPTASEIMLHLVTLKDLAAGMPPVNAAVAAIAAG